MNQSAYARAVHKLHDSGHAKEMIEHCYWDLDVVDAENRFAKGEEASALTEILFELTRAKILRQGSTVVDLGCGNGVTAAWFASRGLHVIAIEPDRDMRVGLEALVQLRERMRLTSQISLLQGCAEGIAISDCSVDLVYMRQVAHHFRDLGRGIMECSRILRRGGALLMTREHIVSSRQQHEEFIAGHPLAQLGVDENAYLSSEYRKALSSAGMQIVKEYGYYESAINHFPIPNADIVGWFQHSLKQSLRITALPLEIIKILSNNRLLQSWYRRRLSRKCQIPGRMHSFLAVRQ